MKYKGVLFDFDGTLVNSMEEHYKGWKFALERFSIDLKPVDLYVLEGQGVERVASQMLQKNNVSQAHLTEVMDAKRAYFEKHNQVRLYPGVPEVLKWLQENGIKMGVVTGGDRARVVRALRDFSVDTFFNGIITADDVTHTKPHPEPFIEGANALGILPVECVVVENAPLGISAAKASGAYCVALTTTLPEKKLREADRVLKDYQELLNYLKKLR